MGEFVDPGYPSPEEAAREDIPPQFARAIGTEVHGDHATVWLLTNGPSDFEPITVYCTQTDGRWHGEGYSGGFQTGTPPDIKDLARELGWR
jgi:hypothetical protein